MFKHAVRIIIILLAILINACGQAPEATVTPTLPAATATLRVATATHTLLPPSATPSPTEPPLDPTSTSAPPAATPTRAPATPTLTPIPTMLPVTVETRTRGLDGMVMVYVPEGEFWMGSSALDRSALNDEKPQHNVYLDAFWIDQTEVTVAQFRTFSQATGYLTLAETRGWADAWVERAGEWQVVRGADWQHPFGSGSTTEADQPVVQIAWADATAYCAWVGGSLPTEAQWEKAARGTDGRIFPWGNLFDGTLLNYCDASCTYGDSSFDDGYPFMAPVRSYPAGTSPYGALDMAGNVWEWTADRYNAGYYAESPGINPAGPENGGNRVLRGGSWNHDRYGMRAASRLDCTPNTAVDNFGFRCVVIQP